MKRVIVTHVYCGECGDYHYVAELTMRNVNSFGCTRRYEFLCPKSGRVIAYRVPSVNLTVRRWER